MTDYGYRLVMVDLSIIIVNWNVRDLLKKCLESIFRETKNISFEIFVVDNNSSDGSQKFLQDLASGTIILSSMIVKKKPRIILNKENLGFALANNQALQESGGEFVLFLNPDTEILDGALDKLVALIKQREHIAALTCKLVNPDGTIQPNIKRNPTFLSQVLIMLKAHHLTTWCQTISDYLARDFDYSREQEVMQIMGAFVLTRRKRMEELRGWDSDYWLWWEDVQLCKDFTARGWKIFYTPIARALHHEGKSFEQVMHLARQKLFNRGMITYFKKNGKLWQATILFLLQPLSLFLAYLAQLLNFKPKPQSKL